MTNLRLAGQQGLQATEKLFHDIQNFLNIRLPINYSLPLVGNDNLEVQFLEKTDLCGIIAERPPFFIPERAVVLGKETVLAQVEITIERCRGHFPDKPIVPLIRLCESIAQTGVILAAQHSKFDTIPIAYGSGDSKALTRELIQAPSAFIIEVKLIRPPRMGVMLLKGTAYKDGEPVGSLDQIKYMAIPRSVVSSD